MKKRILQRVQRVERKLGGGGEMCDGGMQKGNYNPKGKEKRLNLMHVLFSHKRLHQLYPFIIILLFKGQKGYA